MDISNINWTKNEFKAYLLLFAANSDYEESQVEKDIILKIINKEQYNKIHLEFDKDNDYQSIQKIQSGIQKFNYSKNEIDKLLLEVKLLFLSDGNFDILERNLLRSLKKILKA